MREENRPPNLPVQVFTHRYEEIVMREFKAVIPQHLLAKLPEDERFLVETVSKLESQFDWSVEQVIRLNRDVLDLHKRTSTLEQVGPTTMSEFIEEQREVNTKVSAKLDTLWDWKQFLSGKWAVVAGLALLILGGLTKFIFDVLGKLFKP